MLTFSDVTFLGPGINFAESDIPDILIRRPIITTLYTANATFVVPDLCESISVAAVGGGGGGAVGISGTPYGGGGGAGGGLCYRNDIKVIPGETLTIVVGQGGLGGLGGVSGSTPTTTNNGGDGGATYIERSTGEKFLIASGSKGGTTSVTLGRGGGIPGSGGGGIGSIASYGGHGGGAFPSGTVAFPGGGGGAGGFNDTAFGNAKGGNGNPGITVTNAFGGLGGAGGGGGYGYASIGTFAGSGGGTDLAANIYTGSLTNGIPGAQGVSGTQGSDAYGAPDSTTTYGGGGGGAMGGTGFVGRARSGGQGALLLLSPGNFRKFPKPTASQIPNYDIINAPVINVNYSADFRSMTSQMYLNDSEATNLTNTCTIEFWMYMAAARPGINVCLLSPGTLNPSGLFVSLGGASGGQLRIGPYYQITGVSGLRGAAVTTGGSVPTGVWTHIVIQYTAGKLTVYKNGYMQGVTSYTGFAIDSNWNTTSVATSLTVGNYSGAGNFNFNGLISNLRLTKGKALYPSTYAPTTASVQIFTPPTAPYNLTTNGSTGLGWGALTDPLETDVRSLAFSTSNISEDKSIFTGGIGTWVSSGQVPVSTLSPF